ncbi:MAG: cytochrome P450 [Methylocystaceae bacterium]|nr:MAG: cytochrome P450 [Methylocystaceae bacterium]
MFHDPDFLPFTPREKPSFRATVRNFLELYPPAAYRERFFVLRGFRPLVAKTNILIDPELAEEMLITRADEFPRDVLTVRLLSGPINRDSLFFAEGAEWKWQRRAVAPAFRHENLLALVPTYAECARAQIEEWRDAPAGEPVDVMRAMSNTTFSVIERAVLGASASFDRERFLANLGVALGSIGWRRLVALLGLPPNWTPHPGYFRATAAARRLRDATVRLLEERRAESSERRDILGLLLSAKDPESGRVMTDSELVANLYGFLVAGHETSAVALGWSLWLLAKDQASQQRLRDEVARVAGEEKIGPETVERLVFAKQVLQEAMRLFPPAAAVGRQPREDTMIGPYKLPKNEPVFVLLWCLHRHEGLWDEPHAFDPDRFSPEQVKARHRYAYLPFGAGPRICIGMGFALLEMATILAELVRAFRFDTIPGHRLELAPSFTTRPKGGLPLILTPLTGARAKAARAEPAPARSAA